jgi:hypothetical protein
MMLTAGIGRLSAQDDVSGLHAEIGAAVARIIVPLGLLRRQRDSLAYLVAWDRTDQGLPWRRVGVIVKLATSGRDVVAHPTPFMIVPAGSIDAIADLPDSGVRAHVEGSTVILELKESTPLNTIRGWHPDSLYFETPPWGFQKALRTWVRPTYEP